MGGLRVQAASSCLLFCRPETSSAAFSNAKPLQDTTTLGTVKHQTPCSRLSFSGLRMSGRQLENSTCLRREIECDATGVGKFWVRRSDPNFSEQVMVLDARSGQKLKAFPAHVRVLGMKQRSGPMLLSVLPPKLTLPRSVPPVESWEDIANSNLLRRVATSGPRALYADGATAWKRAANHLGIACHQVSHSAKEFTRERKRARNEPSSSRGLSLVCGTQTIDRAWAQMKQMFPQNVPLKIRTEHGSHQHPTVETRVYSWL